MELINREASASPPLRKESKMEVKHNIKMNLTELHYTLEGIDAVIGRPIDENGKDILFQARKQIARPLRDHGLISKEKYKDPFAE